MCSVFVAERIFRKWITNPFPKWKSNPAPGNYNVITITSAHFYSPESGGLERKAFTCLLIIFLPRLPLNRKDKNAMMDKKSLGELGK